VLALAILAGGLTLGIQADEEPQPLATEVRPGMSQEDVVKHFGRPQRVARILLYGRYVEQWVYDPPRAVRIEFDCIRGRPPQILTVHKLQVGKK
jgi:hypothetical protein